MKLEKSKKIQHGLFGLGGAGCESKRTVRLGTRGVTDFSTTGDGNGAARSALEDNDS